MATKKTAKKTQKTEAKKDEKASCNYIDCVVRIAKCKLKIVDAVSNVFLLFLRLWMTKIFIQSGLTKIDEWDKTIALFRDIYQVPLLPVSLAAVLATAVELICPIFLIIGLATRANAFLLFIVMSVAQYVALREVWPDGAIYQHGAYMLALAVLVFYGAGKLSADRFFVKKYLEPNEEK